MQKGFACCVLLKIKMSGDQHGEVAPKEETSQFATQSRGIVLLHVAHVARC